MNRRLWSIPGLLTATVSCGEPSQEAHADLDPALLGLVTDTVFVAGASLSPEDFLGRVTAVAFDAQGNLHALMPDLYEIVTWDDRGRLVRRFGNRGEGPHEFRIPWYAFVTPDGGVTVMDIGHVALQVFSPDGEHVRNMRLPTSNERPVPGGNSVVTNGVFVGVDEYWLSRPRREERGIQLYTFRPVGDSIWAEPYYVAWAPPRGSGLEMLPKLHIAPLPGGGIAVADSVGYRIKKLSAAGVLEGVLERHIDPFPVTAAAMEAHRERKSTEVTERDIARASQNMVATTGLDLPPVDASEVIERYLASLDDLEFTDEIPVIHDIATDWDGRLWVTRSSATGDAGLVDLFTPDAAYAGTLEGVRTPDAFGPGGLMAYINDHHELDTQSVLVARIVSIAPAVEN